LSAKKKDLWGISFEHAKQHVASEEVLTDVNKLPATIDNVAESTKI
jgi:hypothetical protein